MSPYITGSIVDSPVALVITEAGDRPNAMTLSFFSEVSHYPTSLWISVAAGAYTHSLIEETGRFSLILLHQAQKQLALACGAVSGRDRDKCAGLHFHRGPEGYLYLADSLSSIACRVRSRTSAGDHTLFVADILAGEIETRNALRRHLLVRDLL